MASTNKNWFAKYREHCEYRHKQTMCKYVGGKCSMNHCFAIKSLQTLERKMAEHPCITMQEPPK